MLNWPPSTVCDFPHVKKRSVATQSLTIKSLTVTRLESRFSQNDSTPVRVNDSRLGSESFLQNLWVPDGQTQFVCTQTHEHFLLQWWWRLAETFCFACLVVLCYILRIKFHQLAKRETWDFAFTEGSAGHNILTPYRVLMKYLHIVILAVGLILWPWVFSRYSTSKVIQVSQIQIQTKNYIAKYNADAKTEFCLNPNSCHYY